MKGIALTKLPWLEELKICTGYELDGRILDYLPTAAEQQARVRPVYETMAEQCLTSRCTCRAKR